ncbi:MAG: helix-turn-helix transcriptional regulator [Bdellovibrionales bacterium]|nr:helix-turn-helix transcriptional regulator [Bdellovibrionales bacterium]
MDAKQFKEIRSKLDLSQEEMAVLLELSGKTAVSNIETGLRNSGKFSAKFLRYLDSMKFEKAHKVIKEINQFHNE